MMHWSAKFRKLAGIVAVPVWRSALRRHRVAAGVEHRRILRNLGPVRMVVDIGANRGQFSLLARHVFPRASIVAFEPYPHAAKIFRRVHGGDSQVTLQPVALGPDRRRMALHVSESDDSSSLLAITERQVNTFPGTQEKAQVEVTVGPLGDWVSAEDLRGPALLKIDVQGFELEVLRGCDELLSLFQWVYVEASFVELYGGQALAGEVVHYLVERGFALSGVYNLAYDRSGIAIQGDFLFERARI